MITVVDQNGSKFSAQSIDEAVKKCFEYCRKNDKFRVYIYDKVNPYPGYIACWIYWDEEAQGISTSAEQCLCGKWIEEKTDVCKSCEREIYERFI